MASCLPPPQHSPRLLHMLPLALYNKQLPGEKHHFYPGHLLQRVRRRVLCPQHYIFRISGLLRGISRHLSFDCLAYSWLDLVSGRFFALLRLLASIIGLVMLHGDSPHFLLGHLLYSQFGQTAWKSRRFFPPSSLFYSQRHSSPTRTQWL